MIVYDHHLMVENQLKSTLFFILKSWVTLSHKIWQQHALFCLQMSAYKITIDVFLSLV